MLLSCVRAGASLSGVLICVSFMNKYGNSEPLSHGKNPPLNQTQAAVQLPDFRSEFAVLIVWVCVGGCMYLHVCAGLDGGET